MSPWKHFAGSTTASVAQQVGTFHPKFTVRPWGSAMFRGKLSSNPLLSPCYGRVSVSLMFFSVEFSSQAPLRRSFLGMTAGYPKHIETWQVPVASPVFMPLIWTPLERNIHQLFWFAQVFSIVKALIPESEWPLPYSIFIYIIQNMFLNMFPERIASVAWGTSPKNIAMKLIETDSQWPARHVGPWPWTPFSWHVAVFGSWLWNCWIWLWVSVSHGKARKLKHQMSPDSSWFIKWAVLTQEISRSITRYVWFHTDATGEWSL